MDYVVQLDQGVGIGSILYYIEVFGLLSKYPRFIIFGNWEFSFFSRQGKVKICFLNCSSNFIDADVDTDADAEVDADAEADVDRSN